MASERFEWPQWWRDGKLGNRRQLRKLVHDLHGRAIRAEATVERARAVLSAAGQASTDREET